MKKKDALAYIKSEKGFILWSVKPTHRFYVGGI
jgi:hypothetical protein